MNILYLNHYAGSPKYGMEFRPYYMAREWVKVGHQVRIIAADYSHVRSQQPIPQDFTKKHWNEWIDGIDFHWYATPIYNGNGIRRFFNIATFLTRVFMDAKNIVREFRPDVVIASSTYPMDIWVARYLAKKTDAKVIFEVHDIWPLSLIEISGMSPSHPFVRLCQSAENTVYRDSDLVISFFPNLGAHAQSKGLDPSRLAYIPNGISLDEWETTLASPLRSDIHNTIKRLHQKGHTIIVYAGSHGLPNALDNLLDAASILRADPISFILVGDGHERARLAARIKNESILNVHMFQPIPKNQIPSLLSIADAAFIGYLHRPIYRFGISPNKVFDYMMSGIPIIRAIDPDHDSFALADCGLTAPAEDAALLAKTVRQFRDLSIEQRKDMGRRGKNYVLAHHTYSVLAEQFLRTMQDIKQKA